MYSCSPSLHIVWSAKKLTRSSTCTTKWAFAANAIVVPFRTLPSLSNAMFLTDSDPAPAAAALASTEPIAVSTLLQRARQALDRALPLCWVAGEISGFKRAASGHCYFDLKDDAAQIACVLYRNRAALVGFDLRDGAQVEIRVRPAIYEPRGSLQFAVEQARLAGVGRQYEAFLRLKARLAAEGLFDAERKRPLPPLPRRIGLITSTRAAALADMLRVLGDRWPRAGIIIYPASVQGSNAPAELLAALTAANRRADCDVLIIGRGGGSAEDLWAFNDEALARAVAASALPIVSAVGHETDFSLCDFAADARAPTPTAAATLVTPEQSMLRAALNDTATRLQDALGSHCDHLGERLDRIALQLRSGVSRLAPWREALLRLETRLQRNLAASAPRLQLRVTSLARRISANPPAAARQSLRLAACQRALQPAIGTPLRNARHRLDRAAAALAHLNPDNVLERGYALLLDDHGQLLGDSAAIHAGDALTVRTHRRQIAVRAERVTAIGTDAAD